MAKDKPADPGVSRILLRAAALDQERQRANRSAVLRMLKLESTATLMLGTGSLALAIVMTIVTIVGLFGIPVANWSQPRTWVVQSGAAVGASVGLTRMVGTRKIFLPSNDCVLLGLLGLVLGGLGILLSLQRRRFSWLSAVGFTLILMMMMLVIVCGTVMNLMP
jgi:hypothetical protein